MYSSDVTHRLRVENTILYKSQVSNSNSAKAVCNVISPNLAVSYCIIVMQRHARATELRLEGVEGREGGWDVSPCAKRETL